MKFAFSVRMTVEGEVFVEAETEQAAWAQAIDADNGEAFAGIGNVSLRKPIYKRLPELDQGGYDL